jgi:hypothetical protein
VADSALAALIRSTPALVEPPSWRGYNRPTRWRALRPSVHSPSSRSLVTPTTPERTPRHVSSEYYALPQRVLYRSYPVYRPDREPAGYFDRLQTLEPEVVLDPRALRTEADWVEADRLVFEMPIDFNGPIVGRRMAKSSCITVRT